MIGRKMTNVARLREQLQFVTTNSKHHDQSVWARKVGDNACGTTACLAGWTALNCAKDQLIPVRKQLSIRGEWTDVVEFQAPNDDWIGFAAGLLDLDWDIADELFNADNTIWDLWHIANIITNGEIEIPESVQADERDRVNRTDDDDFEDWLRELAE
jgi:hypothetical protein